MIQLMRQRRSSPRAWERFGRTLRHPKCAKFLRGRRCTAVGAFNIHMLNVDMHMGGIKHLGRHLRGIWEASGGGDLAGAWEAFGRHLEAQGPQQAQRWIVPKD